MIPPIFTTLQASATVRGLLGAKPRVFRMGEAPQNCLRPYATYLVFGAPENTLSESPSIDRDSVQIDIFGTTDAEVEDAASAVRDQMETVTHMTAWRVSPRDSETRLFRISMDFDFWLHR